MESFGTVKLADGRTIKLRPYKLIELANIYGMHRNTFRVWIAEFKDKIGPRRRHYYTVRQVLIIVQNLGIPATIEYDEFL